jgi:hypothetical protein
MQSYIYFKTKWKARAPLGGDSLLGRDAVQSGAAAYCLRACLRVCLSVTIGP